MHDDAWVLGKLLHHEADAGSVVGAIAPRRCKHKHVVIESLHYGDAAGDFEVVGEEMIGICLKRHAHNTWDGA